MDADVYGPSLPLLTGATGRPRVVERPGGPGEEPKKGIIPLEALGLKLMSMGFFISDDSPVIWRGPMAQKYIKEFLDRAAWGELDYLIVHPASAGHGLNLQHGGHHVIFYGLTWNLEHYTQTIARLWRSGQSHKVIVHRLIAFDTVDDDVCKALDRKGAVQKDLLDALKERTG
ncbi:MAG: P-loop NTPase [Proteobacteria bacterium]|nr:P-loop NTPase [Pseudomonadota bacterium]